ncbi:MAG: decaprenyl-phosphate phosphoribosyltransferase [candidate division WOR-3 bacterium]|nr:decaprenyl-phosphate phosphoribosyltransferase [candidate division WOR-3 bacterium]
MKNYLLLLRPEQWVKNVFLFAGLIFSREFHDLEKAAISLTGFVIFSLLSSAGYIINDLVDYRLDLEIPTKKNRPIAAGKIKIPEAIFIAIVIVIITLYFASRMDREFFLTASGYIALSIAYSLFFKSMVILDVLMVAIGYVLRSVAGAVIIDVEISSWLILCTFLLALFIVLAKRRAEMLLLGHEADKHRRVLYHYSVDMLNQMISITISACIVSYCIYTLSPETVNKFHTRNLILTIPFVIYGMFRYLYVIEKKTGADMPNQALISDLPTIINFCLWIVTCILVLSI